MSDIVVDRTKVNTVLGKDAQHRVDGERVRQR